MSEVEVAFKVKQKQRKCERLLKKAGFKLFHKATTHDIYFTDRTLTEDMSEQELKFACVRIRCSNGGYRVHNYNIYDPTAKDEFRCTKEEAERLITFTNNSGPLFILGTVGITLFYDSSIDKIQSSSKILSIKSLYEIFLLGVKYINTSL